MNNDSDPDGDQVRIKFSDTDRVSDNGGTIKWNRNGTPDNFADDKLVYRPAEGFTGTDSFTYAISDGKGGMDMANVVINVTGDGGGGNPPSDNSAPNAVNDSRTTDLNTPININVLANDSDPDGDGLSVTSVEGQSINVNQTIQTDNGSVTRLANNQLNFTPNDGFTGTEAFTYHVSDGKGGEDTATVSVSVEDAPTPPTPTSGTIVGSDSIRESGTANYKVQLDQAVTEDTFITVRIKDGTAQQTSESSVFEYEITNIASGGRIGDIVQYYAPTQPIRDYIFTVWYNDPAWGTPANAHTPNNGSGVYNGVDALVNDFRVFNPNGDVVTGETFTVKVAAGSAISEEFQVFANYEVNTGAHISGIGAFDTEETESFSLHIESIGGNDATGDLEIDILDKRANISPLAFDLNGDGIQTISIDEGVEFDMLNSGFTVNTGWLSGEDAFLATDDNGNGIIDDRSELFGGGVGEGFAELATFDSNGDGVVNSSDDRFSELLVWQDANENAITDAGELVSLEDTGIASISTEYTDVFSKDAQGNILGEFGSATRVDGSSLEVVDVYFQVEA